MKSDFALAFKQILDDRGLPQEVVVEAIKDALVSAYRRAVRASTAQQIEAKIDLDSGKVQIFAEKEVVEEVQNEHTEVTLDEARRFNPEARLGDMVMVECTPEDFGRVAAQTARQVIQQRIREAEREIQYKYYIKQVGDIVNGVVQAVNPKQITLGLDLKAEGIMPRRHQIPREYFRVHDRVRALLVEVQESTRGPKIILSRAHPDFLRRLLENEVPEIYQGMVEIRSIAREPGQRSKVAVAALQPGIDPVGACVGVRGVRIQTIVRELNDEKIDVIEWNPDPAVYIAKALSPARVLSVFLENIDGTRTATVIVPEDQLSLAIGRDGQNARLTAKLTGWRIDIKSLIEATSELLFKLKNDPDYAEYYEQEKEYLPQIEAIMRKKIDGRPILPEEYQELHSLIERVERDRLNRIHAREAEEAARLKAAREAVPQDAYDLPLETLGFSDNLNALLQEHLDIHNVGDLLFQMNYDPEAVRAIKGIGPKAMEQIEETVGLLQASYRKQAEEAAAEEARLAAEAAAEEQAATEEIAKPEEAESAPPETEEQPVPEESLPEAEAKPEAEEAEPEAEPEAVTEEPLPETMQEIIETAPEMLDVSLDEDEEERLLKEEREKERKRKKYVEVEYDPDRGVTIYRKKHKRGGKDWEDWDDEDWDF
ncbi:MAG: transcription termination/antitermination protein NusA [Anaerolineae bacterium]|nr:MAG: transcription termination/antitermination protein NusA [Anaerolineae bacterium]